MKVLPYNITPEIVASYTKCKPLHDVYLMLLAFKEKHSLERITCVRNDYMSCFEIFPSLPDEIVDTFSETIDDMYGEVSKYWQDTGVASHSDQILCGFVSNPSNI